MRIKSYKFLLDENVRIELRTFLQTKGYNTKLALKAVSDKQIATISKNQKRILVTNDDDFLEYSKDQIYSIVFLKLPQNELNILLSQFNNLFNTVKAFKGKSIILGLGKIDINPLPKVLEVKEK